MNGRLHLLLIRRGAPPCAGAWALPGGFIDMDESLDDGAVRELEEETGLKDIQLRQFHAFGDPGRDPRGRTITIAYWGMVTEEKARLATAGDDAKSLDWFPIDSLPALAFDHSDVISVAIEAAGKEGALS